MLQAIEQATQKAELTLPVQLRQDIDSVLVDDMSTRYKIYKIPKKKSGFRTISAPDDDLKRVQRNLLDYFVQELNISRGIPDWVQGFMPNKSIVTNAMHHGIKFKANFGIGKKVSSLEFRNILGKNFVFLNQQTSNLIYIQQNKDVEHNFSDIIKRQRQVSAIKLDIKSAFDSVGRTLIKRGWPKGMRFVEEDFDRIMQLCLLNECLPQGAPTSPLLLNIGLLPLDFYVKNLLRIAQFDGKLSKKPVYTRYADDITISVPNVDQNKEAHKAIYYVVGAAKALGLSIKMPKTKVMSQKNGILVTGINIVNSSTHISVSRRKRNNIRAKIFNYAKHGGSTKELDSIIGNITYVNSIDKGHGGSLIAYAIKLGVLNKNHSLNRMTAESCNLIGQQIRNNRKIIYENYK